MDTYKYIIDPVAKTQHLITSVAGLRLLKHYVSEYMHAPRQTGGGNWKMFEDKDKEETAAIKRLCQNLGLTNFMGYGSYNELQRFISTHRGRYFNGNTISYYYGSYEKIEELRRILERVWTEKQQTERRQQEQARRTAQKVSEQAEQEVAKRLESGRSGNGRQSKSWLSRLVGSKNSSSSSSRFGSFRPSTQHRAQVQKVPSQESQNVLLSLAPHLVSGLIKGGKLTVEGIKVAAQVANVVVPATVSGVYKTTKLMKDVTTAVAPYIKQTADASASAIVSAIKPLAQQKVYESEMKHQQWGLDALKNFQSEEPSPTPVPLPSHRIFQKHEHEDEDENVVIHFAPEKNKSKSPSAVITWSSQKDDDVIHFSSTKLRTPPKMSNVLRKMLVEFKPHQKRVIQYCKEYDPPGMILYHGLGSGKTITALGMTNLYQDRKTVCIVPASMRLKWIHEIETRGLRPRQYSVLSYDELNSPDIVPAMFDGKIIVFDEAHRLRSAGSKKTQKAQLLTQNAFKIFLLTGTPMVNSPKDLAVLVNLIYRQQYISTDAKKFERQFYTRTPSVKNTGSQKKEIIIGCNEKAFQKAVRCTTSYFQPEKIIEDYPTSTVQDVRVKMSSKQNAAYVKATQKLSALARDQLENGVINIRRKQDVFLNLSRRTSNIGPRQKTSPKLEEIVKHCVDGPKPCLVYSNWLQSGVKPLSELLTQAGLRTEVYTGSVTDEKKEAMVDAYNDSEVDVLLISSSGAEGLDLKNTRQIHIMDPHFNKAKIDQVIGRGIRYRSHSELPVQDRHVNVYKWISVPNLPENRLGADEYLYKISAQKVDLMQSFLKILQDTSIEQEDCETNPLTLTE